MGDSNKPIKVLQIIGLSCGGGVEAVILNYYKHIDRSKVQFDFVVHKNPFSGFVDPIKKLGGKVYEVTPYTENMIAFTYEIYQIIKDGHYNVVHSNMNSLSFFPLAAAWAAGARVRILHNHTTDSTAEGLRTVAKRVLRPFSKIFANQYWACSKLAAEWMYGKEALRNGEVTIINNAIDLQQYSFNQEKRDNIRKKYALENKFVIGHVGRFVTVKNHKFIIQIFAEIIKEKPNFALILVGDGPLRNQVQEQVKRLGLQKNVIFTGIRNDVADLYNVMDAFVLPSFYEGLPVVGVEAQANGLLTYFSDQVTQEAIISDKAFFISLKKGPDYWAKRICEKEYYNRNDLNIIDEYNIEKAVKSLVKIYLCIQSS